MTNTCHARAILSWWKKETEILGSFNSQEKVAAGSISWFDPGAEALWRSLSLFFCVSELIFIHYKLTLRHRACDLSLCSTDEKNLWFGFQFFSRLKSCCYQLFISILTSPVNPIVFLIFHIQQSYIQRCLPPVSITPSHHSFQYRSRAADLAGNGKRCINYTDELVNGKSMSLQQAHKTTCDITSISSTQRSLSKII